ncbi:MAG: hypothetical protein J7J76_09345 [Candidatus Latescibacteria bacterium]|nr:hypothetical protein [Candidatus Latescibacterota bacterium]
MRKLLPVVHHEPCRVCIAQAPTSWHNGNARPEWADYWIQRYAIVTDD